MSVREYLNKRQPQQIALFFILYIFSINYAHIYSHQNLSFLRLLLSFLNVALVWLWVKKEGFEQLQKVAIQNLQWIELVFWIMILFIDLSKMFHGRFNLVIFPFLFFGRILPTYINQSNYQNFVRLNLIGTLPFLLHPLYGKLRYATYYNNSVGVLQTIITYFVLTVLYEALTHKRNKEILMSLLFLLVNVGMIYLTGSRTAIMTAFFLISYFGYYLTKEKIKPLTLKKALVILIGLALILYLSKGLLLNIYQTTFLKWDRGIPGFDFTFTGRTDIWGYTLKRAQFLGGGQRFFKGVKRLNHGHNILFNILGFYGVIPFLAMSLVVLYLLYLFFKLKQLPVRLFILLFVLVNMFEGAIANYQHSYFELLFFFHFHWFINQRYNKNTTMDKTE